MNLTQVILSLLCVTGMSVGQILFKLGAPRFLIDLKNADFIHLITNFYIVTAIGLYAGIIFLWIILLGYVPLKIAYPVQALAFVIVPILSSLIIGESLQMNTFVGAALIITGIVVCVWKQSIL
jgi:drug/metabolite transporter (DMT)-like permease